MSPVTPGPGWVKLHAKTALKLLLALQTLINKNTLLQAFLESNQREESALGL